MEQVGTSVYSPLIAFPQINIRPLVLGPLTDIDFCSHGLFISATHTQTHAHGNKVIRVHTDYFTV